MLLASPGTATLIILHHLWMINAVGWSSTPRVTSFSWYLQGHARDWVGTGRERYLRSLSPPPPAISLAISAISEIVSRFAADAAAAAAAASAAIPPAGVVSGVTSRLAPGITASPDGTVVVSQLLSATCDTSMADASPSVLPASATAVDAAAVGGFAPWERKYSAYLQQAGRA